MWLTPESDLARMGARYALRPEFATQGPRPMKLILAVFGIALIVDRNRI
jgi:hypothetical protein